LNDVQLRRRQPQSPSPASLQGRRHAVATAVALLGWTGMAGAQVATEAPRPLDIPEVTTRISTALEARTIATSNAAYVDGQAQRDIVVEVQPSVAFERRGSNLGVKGKLALAGFDYLNNTQASRVMPRGRLDVTSKLVDDLLFFDALLRVDPTAQDPFLAQPDAQTAYRLEPRTLVTLSPHLNKRFSEFTSFAARSDYTVSRVKDLPTQRKTTSTLVNNEVSFEQKPMPIGFAATLTSHVESTTLLEEDVIDSREARVWLLGALGRQFTVGVVGGQERTTLQSSHVNERIYGGRFNWQPTPRTEIRALVEHRYFGKGWDVGFRHYSPFVSLEIQSQRLVSSQQSAEVVFGRGSSIEGVLDSMLTTRFPDPAARQREIDRIVAANNLPQVASDQIALYATAAQLRENLGVRLGLQGRRNIIYVQASATKQEALRLEQQIFPPTADYDYSTRDASVGWNLRLSPVTTTNLIGEWRRVESIGGAQLGNYTTQFSVRAEVVRALSTDSWVTLGARRLTMSSNFLNANETAGEKAIYAGIRHRF
jgi:uncharacterized protein (PEP-CTERM system associated)